MIKASLTDLSMFHGAKLCPLWKGVNIVYETVYVLLFLYAYAYVFFYCHAHATSAATKAEIDTMQAHLPDECCMRLKSQARPQSSLIIDTDTILYAKNATSSMYPASTTKLMTAYLTLSNTSLDDIVTFSKNSIYSLPSGSSHIGMHIGESLSVRDCLYGLLLPSAMK